MKNVSSDDSDQTARMRRLILIFARRKCLKVRSLTLLHIILRVNRITINSLPAEPIALSAETKKKNYKKIVLFIVLQSYF